jgi:hypothetical protein
LTRKRRQLSEGAAAGLAGSIAGALATVLMTAVMFGAQRLGLLGRMPPETVTARVLDRFGVRRTREQQDMIAGVGHLAFGATMGALFAVGSRTVSRRARSWPFGLVYGAGIWLVSYAGWVPALGLMAPPHRDRPGRPRSMFVAHLLYGASQALIGDRLMRMLGADRSPAR